MSKACINQPYTIESNSIRIIAKPPKARDLNKTKEKTNHIIEVILAHHILPSPRKLYRQISVLWIYNCPKQLHSTLRCHKRKGHLNRVSIPNIT